MGTHFSDFKFHNIVFPQLGFGKNDFGVDYGRFNVTGKYSDLYKFRTSPLTNVEFTGPYGHSGSLEDLEEVIKGHFDPLSLYDTKNLDEIKRKDLFLRIQNTYGQPTPSYLDKVEIEKLIEFSKTLSFEKQ